MLRTLRRRFITIAMTSVAIVLILLICAINIANYINISNSADIFLDILSGNRGSFPMLDEANNRGSSGVVEYLYSRHFHIPAEAAYSTRYFTVTLSEDGTVHTINTSKISAVSASKASKYATALFGKEKKTGFVDNYKYRLIEMGEDVPKGDGPKEDGLKGDDPKGGDSKGDDLKGNVPKGDGLKGDGPKEDGPLRDQGRDSDDSGRRYNTAAYMYIFLDCEQELSTFHNFLIASIAISAGGFLLVFLLVLFFSKRAIRPVAESYSKQKRFITDASHEIKTPLTIIDANTEIIEMMGGENEWTQSIRNQIRRLTELTNKMVFLTRMDEENQKFTMLDFSLSDVVHETVEPFQAVAKTKNFQLDIKVEPNISYHGDEGTIRQLVSLLVDNAVKYCSGQGEIRVELRNVGRNRILTVWNTVDGIEKGSHDELFDRFYRRDASRSQKTAGYGIGLSVALAIVQAHKGRITAKSEDGSSICFTVTL